jgi:hypothetical protein
VYRVWGNLPYEPGDHLTDGALDALYPGYQDSSYFHDESGFVSPTPYGDTADCILTDAEQWLLDRYAVILVAGAISGGVELRDKLQAYVERGGHLVMTAGNLARLPGGLEGVTVAGAAADVAPGAAVVLGDREVRERTAFSLAPLSLPPTARVVARCGELPAVVELHAGKGRLTVLASPFGVPAEAVTSLPVTSSEDASLPRPFPLLLHVRLLLDRAFRATMLFEVDSLLSLIICRRAPGEYLLAVNNNALAPRPLEIVSHCGPILAIRETEIDQSEKSAVGYLPEGFERARIGSSDGRSIAGGDVRIFAVSVREQAVVAIPHRRPPVRPRGRILFLRGAGTIKEHVLSRPTFFEHFDGVMVDWRRLAEREQAAIRHDAGWVGRQKLRVMVDLSSGLNLYPDLRLVDNIAEEYAGSMRSIADVLAKMNLLGSQDLLLSLHRLVENNISAEDAWRSIERTVRGLCADAESRGIRVHLRLDPAKPPADIPAALGFLERVGSAGLLIAPSLGSLLHGDAPLSGSLDALRGRVGLWLAGAPRLDLGGVSWTVQAPLASGRHEARLGELLSIAPEAPVVLDAVYDGQDAEYLDARLIERSTQRAIP